MEMIFKFLSENKDNNSPLPSDIKRIIDEVLWSGISIGLLAEWRVWCFVIDYLRDELNKGYQLGEKTQWLKQFKDIENINERHA